MSVDRFTLDSNVLFYAADTASGAKHDQAIEIIDRAAERDCVLTVQALSEFFFAVSRKKPLLRSEASRHILDWINLFPIVAASGAALMSAMPMALAGQLSFWDAMLMATAREAGCTTVLSEDMGDGSRLGGVKVRNPFGGSTMPDDVRRLLGIS